MIIWSGNFLLDDTTINNLSSQLKFNRGSYSERQNHFSSYYLKDDERPESVLSTLYQEITNHLLTQLTLAGRVDHWGDTYWMQVYPPGSGGHESHDHFTGNELYSWVHFLRPVKKSFNFIVDGQKVYPEQQNPGDFIVFPSWALHSVDVNDTDTDRVVIAGNLILNSLSVRQKLSRCHMINRNILVWETTGDD